MIKFKKCLLLLSLLFVFPFSTYCKEVTILDMYKAAVENREVVKSYRLALEQAKLEQKIQKGDYLPSLDASYKANKLDESSLLENEENSEFAVSLTQNLFNGFKDKLELAIADLDLKTSDFELSGLKHDIGLDVALKVLQVYQAEARRHVAMDAFKAYSERYENIQLKYNVGVAKKRDVLTVKVEKDDAEQSLIKAENEVEKTINSLNRVTGLSLKFSDIDFSEFETLPVFSPLEEYKSTMLSNRTDFKILKTGLEKAENTKELAKASFYPKIDLVLMQRYYSDEYFAFDSDTKEDETRIQLKLGINLFDGMKKYKNIDKAELETEKIRYSIAELEDELTNELSNLLIDARTAEKNLFVAREGIREAEENLRITELSFEKGVATATDVLDSIYYLSRARNNEITAKANIFMTLFYIKRLVVDYPAI
ncbi:MAG: TolC family protein [Desulfobacteraceae bacterium]|nr:TolC family protein [Desulfobacteraceae bacterium]MCB9494169.1 TolC family protein [Desulfobacteraceae bacterium]